MIVGQKVEDKMYFGLIDDEEYRELLPIKYNLLENYDVKGYIAKNIDGSK